MLRELEKLRFAEGRRPRRGGERGQVRAWGDVTVSGPRLKAVALLRTLGFFSHTSAMRKGLAREAPSRFLWLVCRLKPGQEMFSSAWARGHSLQCPFPFLGEKPMVGVEG